MSIETVSSQILDDAARSLPGITEKSVSKNGGRRPGAGRKPKVRLPIQYVNDIPRWFCVRTTHGAEIAADVAIRQAGFETFFPLLWIAPKAAYRAEGGRAVAGRSERLVPLFQGYLFVRFLRSDPSWRHIVTMRGVDYIFSTSPTTPTPVPDKSIERIRDMCAPNGAVYPAGSEARIKVGGRGKVAAFPDVVGICEWTDGERVRLLMQIMGREVPVIAQVSAVEPVWPLQSYTPSAQTR